MQKEHVRVTIGKSRTPCARTPNTYHSLSTPVTGIRYHALHFILMVWI
jgi:hypothetical protein